MEPVIEMATTFLASVNRSDADYYKYGPHFTSDPRAHEIARIIETQLGIKQIEPLGSGSFGTAAATKEYGGEVLKLTTDPSEVEAATVLTSVPDERYPKNVVRVTGAWFLRKLKVVALKGMGGPDHPDILGNVRIGLIRMERVHQVDDLEAVNGLSEWTKYVKWKFKAWPWQLRGLSKEKQRARMLAAGQEMERMLMQLWNDEGEQLARDVARGIVQLRAEGIYGTDFHGGNVGYALKNELPGRRPSTVPPTRERLERQRVQLHKHKNVPFDVFTLQGEPHEWYYEIEPTKQRSAGRDARVGPFVEPERAVDRARIAIDELLSVEGQLGAHENPLTEETMVHRGVHFDLITTKTETQAPSYYIRFADEFDNPYGPFGVRDEAIEFAHDKIDKVMGSSSPVPASMRPFAGKSTGGRPSGVPPDAEMLEFNGRVFYIWKVDHASGRGASWHYRIETGTAGGGFVARKEAIEEAQAEIEKLVGKSELHRSSPEPMSPPEGLARDHRGVRYELLARPGGRWSYRVESSPQVIFGPEDGFERQEDAEAEARGAIDRYLDERERREGRIYKLFDVGQSSIPSAAPRPGEIPAAQARRRRASKRDESEQLALPIVKEKVKVAELG